MADPFYFPSYDGGGIADTRRELGLPARIDRERAMAQWRSVAEALCGVGMDVYAIGPEKDNPGLALLGGAALIPRAEEDAPAAEKTAVRATPPPPRSGEQSVYERTLRGFGFEVTSFEERFGAAADVMRCGEQWLFLCGQTHRGRVAPRLGFPPWRRLYGFGTDPSLRERTARLLAARRVQSLQLVDPSFPHGDTAVCPIGAERRILMVHLDALDEDARRMALSDRLAEQVIPLERGDAARRAANSVQVARADGSCVLLCPAGISDDLAARIEGVGVEPLQIEVGEFLKRGGGIKRLVADLGLIRDDRRTQSAEVRDFRRRLRFTPSGASQPGASSV